MIYIVACGKSKLDHPTEARHMYQGSYFNACFRYAWEFSEHNLDKIYIISAKYGLIPCDTVIDPYDIKMGDEGSVTVEQVKEQAKNITGPVTVLGGKLYVKFLKDIFPNLICPLKGGMLTQIKWMNEESQKHIDEKQLSLWGQLQ